MQIKYLIFAFVAGSFAIPNPKAEPEPEPLPAPVSEPNKPGSLVARACSYTTGCRSERGAAAGTYCGFCFQVEGTYVNSHIYQVNGGTGASSCCDYGVATACRDEWARNPTYRQCANNGRGY